MITETIRFPDDNTILIVNYKKEGEEEEKSIQNEFTRLK